MTDNEFFIRIGMLENRPIPQMAALEELTRILLAQEERIREQAETIKRPGEQVRALLPSQLALPEEEAPPPRN
jgi:uncharacterized coiled-coil protein SlyX